MDWNVKARASSQPFSVASFTDAWIETFIKAARPGRSRSHLLQMRGLKPPNIRSLYQWPLSHLLQMRGLKLPADADQIKSDCRIFYRCVDWNLKDRNLPLPSASSHLLQMRGLKPLLLIWWAIRLVASFTDAWIETDKILGQIHFNWSHLLQMRGLKRRLLVANSIGFVVASFTDAWIETILPIDLIICSESHLLQMRGLKPHSKGQE